MAAISRSHLQTPTISGKMPAQRAAAVFDPISPDLDLAALVEQTPNFHYVTRIPCEQIEQQGLEQFEKLILHYVILGGKPLVVDGYNNRLNQWTFSTQWLRDNVGKKCKSCTSWKAPLLADNL